MIQRQVDITQILANLDSAGVGVYLAAILQKDKSRQIQLFGKAATFLEEELKEIGLKPSARRDLLNILDDCYSSLIVETALPPKYRIQPDLPHDWTWYIQRKAGIAKELVQ